MESTEDGFELVQELNEDFQQESDEAERDTFLYLLKYLQKTAVESMEAFQDSSDTSRTRIHAVFCLIDHHLEGLETIVSNIYAIANDYDYNGLRANGYRSVLKTLRLCCERILEISGEIISGKDNFLLSLRSGYRDLESFVACLGQLKWCADHLLNLPERSEEGCLFARTDDSLFTKEADEIFSELESLNREPFYGRCLGNSFCKSMQNPLKMVNVAMASFGESFHKETIMNKWALSFMSSGKYFMNPELRAQQVVKTTQNSSIAFCKAFWNIAESDLLQELPMVVCPPVQVSHPFEIEPKEFQLPRADGSGMVDIKIPTSHVGVRPIIARLISHVVREGQEQLLHPEKNPQKLEAQSRCLILHCHGGGWLAQSSKSHEVYLRYWARAVGVPILSIDYSLAPEAPYPRGLEEVFYAYCWAMDNCDLLGSSGDRICFAGDSSGGNLILGACLKAIQEGVRAPDGLLCIYPATYVSYAPSPSRLLGMMDPLLPVGVLTRCLAAYAGHDARDAFHYYVKKRQGMNDGFMDPVVQELLDQIEAKKMELELANQGPSTIWYVDKSGEMLPESDIIRDHGNCDNGLPSNGCDVSPDNGSCYHTADEDSADSDSKTDLNKNKQTGGESSDVKFTMGDPDDNSSQKIDQSNNPMILSAQNLLNQSNGLKTTDEHSDQSQSKCMSRDISTDQSDHFASFDETESESDDRVKLPTSKPSHITENGANVEIQRSSHSAHPRLIPRRSSEQHLHKPSSAPPRSSSVANFATQFKPQKDMKSAESSFQWTSLVSSATKTKIRNNLTSIGNYMWGSGPNNCKTMTVQKPETPENAVLSPDVNLPLHVYRYLPVPADPLMSPYLADLETLGKMPPVYLMACHLDPLLDDSIELAKRLDQAGAEVHLDVLDDLPHGFLNFTLVSREAKLGCDNCIVRIREILLHTPR